jgi:hypothetical protein
LVAITPYSSAFLVVHLDLAACYSYHTIYFAF